jgi:endonuclease/exonuclease/phosphatase family metal-dependent hydrolase
MLTRSTLRALLLAGFVLTSLAVLGASPASADVTKYFMEFNACANSDNGCFKYDNPDGGSTPKTVSEAIADSILDPGRPRRDAVILNEICRSQLDELEQKLRNRNYPMDARFAANNFNVNGCPGSDTGTDDNYGIAVLTQGGDSIIDNVTDSQNFNHQAGSETRKYLCVKVNWAIDTRVCSVHLTPNDQLCDGKTCRERQAIQIKNLTDNYAGFGTPIVVGGDFNAEPPAAALDHLYDQQIFGGGAVGRFKELDQFFGPGDACRCGENTWHSEADPNLHRKLDYVFLSAGKWNDVDGGPTYSPYSDHDPYLGRATLDTP